MLPLYVLGLFPPPTNGQTVLTEKFAGFIETHLPIRRVDMGHGAIGKAGAHIRAALILLTLPAGTTVYSTPPGQSGIWLFLFCVAAARLRNLRLYIHHHSFRPFVSEPMLSMRLLVAIGGNNIHHIFLGERMKDAFWNVYPGNDRERRSFVLPNAFAYPPPPPPPPKSGPITLGHMSVLVREKGISTVIAIFEHLRTRGHDVRLIVAGPLLDKTLINELDMARKKYEDAFEYRGAVYGPQKKAFFADIDLFLLPSSLQDEADPLVIQEAYEAGVEVMSTNRGCIAERLRRPDAFLFLNESDPSAVENIVNDLEKNRSVIREQTWAHAAALHKAALKQAALLIKELLPG